MSKVILTRYLYIYDECCLAFINSLLKKHDVKECYFWISEIYLSGFKIQSWQLLWFIYFDFYFINNPSFTSFIENKHNKNTFNDLLTVVKNLFKLVPDSKIFLTRQYNSQIKKVDFIFRGKKPKWLTDDYPPNYYALFRFLNKKLYHFAVSSLPNQIDDDLLVYIQKYFKVSDELFISLKNYCNSSYDNFNHKIWAIICLLEFTDKNVILNKKMYISISDIELTNIFDIHDTPIPLSKYNNLQIYKTLSYKREYSIPKSISAFYLSRENIDNINHLFWYHWEYYAYNSPLWKERFDKFNITINDEKQKIEFNDDDELEEFYQQWGYEPHEQSSDTINKRMVDIEHNNCDKWHKELFEIDPIYSFPQDFRFNY
jgi:hypothetical protein